MIVWSLNGGKLYISLSRSSTYPTLEFLCCKRLKYKNFTPFSERKEFLCTGKRFFDITNHFKWEGIGNAVGCDNPIWVFFAIPWMDRLGKSLDCLNLRVLFQIKWGKLVGFIWDAFFGVAVLPFVCF